MVVRKHRNRPRGEDAKKRERAIKALELRIAGAAYRQIATQLNVSLHCAYDDVQNELGRLDAVAKKKAERMRELEAQRLDQLTVALAPSLRVGDPRAIATAVRLMERRAKLFGLDAPTELSGPGGGPIVMKQVIHQQLQDDAD
jgi:transposase